MSAGFAFAAALFTRPHLAVAPAICGIWAAVRRRRSLRPVWQVGMASLLGVAGLLIYTAITFGRVGRSAGIWGDAGENLSKTTPAGIGVNLLGTLISLERGVLVLSPFSLLLLPGTLLAWRIAPWWVRGELRFRHGLPRHSDHRELLRRWRRLLLVPLPHRDAHALCAAARLVLGFRVTNRSEAWSHYLLIDGFRHATPTDLVGISAVTVVTASVVWRLLLRPARSPGQEVVQTSDDGVPAPALLDPLPAAPAHPLGQRGVEQHRAEPVGDR